MQQMTNAHNMVNQAGAQPGEEMQANETVGFVPVEQVLPKRMNKERLIKAMQGLITNFHLPESTLVMLVSAFAGREHVLNAYRQAVEEKYRFFSFGDAMLII